MSTFYVRTKYFPVENIKRMRYYVPYGTHRYNFSISSGDRPVTFDTFSIESPKANKVFAVSSLACCAPKEMPSLRPYSSPAENPSSYASFR
ncbi:MAG: hypothetical protein J6B11_03660 [Spirochaetales bacterium]|nr:hypothetical protein [Spirochaetales bacterium]